VGVAFVRVTGGVDGSGSGGGGAAADPGFDAARGLGFDAEHPPVAAVLRRGDGPAGRDRPRARLVPPLDDHRSAPPIPHRPPAGFEPSIISLASL